ncbi:NAD-dependent epimerase/dehydratase family protein [Arvimicrobium flavum]|uniref:NAD-dependent epimerase/dehydratase family protein n=1 Tax=Arvimicrobium flavum TaxID=3393320 RepID=UPI00237BB3ED|nr:NAD(P)-dependent oxidoreductase [Mesorhizobium shangrilense]
MTRKIVVSGGTGFVGRFIVERLLADGHAVRVLGRTAPPDGFFTGPVEFVAASLEPTAIGPNLFADAGAFVHAAFDHIPGKYRGGEGSDPAGFRRLNIEGSAAMFDAARVAGVERVVFLSSRAVYGTQAAGAVLMEATEPRPDTLYGEVKLEAERRLLAMAGAGFAPTVLRVTGVYGPAGPGRAHKWQQLFADFLDGQPIAPRVATEVHGQDVASAASLMLAQEPPVVSRQVYNASDIVVDLHDLLGIVARVAGASALPPERADAAQLNVMSTARLKRLGWRPGGVALLERSVAELVRMMPVRPA